MDMACRSLKRSFRVFNDYVSSKCNLDAMRRADGMHTWQAVTKREINTENSNCCGAYVVKWGTVFGSGGLCSSGRILPWWSPRSNGMLSFVFHEPGHGFLYEQRRLQGWTMEMEKNRFLSGLRPSKPSVFCDFLARSGRPKHTVSA